MSSLEHTESLTDEERDFLQHRVASFGASCAAILLGFWGYRLGGCIAAHDPRGFLKADMLFHLFSGLCFLATWLICRFGKHPAQIVRAVETGGLMGGCALLQLMGAHIPLHSHPELIVALALTYCLVTRSIVVPSSASRTLALGVAIGVPYVAIFYGAALGVDLEAWSHLDPVFASMTPESFARFGASYAAAWWVCSLSLATATSWVLYGLREEVRDAVQLGQYRLERKLGAGGMGEVYQAKHVMLRRPAAIKLMRPQPGGTDGLSRRRAVQRFEREAQVTAGLTSPHTVQLYDFGVSAKGNFYYVMELLTGVDLETLVKKFGPLPAERVVYLLRQACESLEEAHTAGLVHRDIKPANLFLCKYGIRHDFLKVLDFGLVALEPECCPQDVRLTVDGVVGGTPSYLAPETINSVAATDERSDLYALGCVAYWLLTGSVLFERATPLATMLAHVNDPPVPPGEVAEQTIPEALEQAILACLAKDPGDRPATAAELEQLLRGAIDTDAWTETLAKSWWELHRPGQVKSEAVGTVPVEGVRVKRARL